MSLPFDPSADYYRTLGVSDTAEADEIKKAYRRLAKQYHPDSTGGDKAKEVRFKEISAAYDVLGDAGKRAQYDAFRAGPPPGGFGGAGFDPSGFGGGFGGIDLGDLFSQVFSGAVPGSGRGPGGGPGGHVNYRVYSSDGQGPEPDLFGRSGRGRKRRVRRDGAPPRPTRPRPPSSETRVRAADGSRLTQKGNDVHSDVRIGLDQAILGSVVEVPTLTGSASIKIPPGTSSGAKLRLKEKGALAADGARGDHYVTVQIDVPKTIDEKSKKLLVDFMKRTKRPK
ncbi:MAG TPA: DnaJ domain-containing protein [Kofleriaceae bacterium]|nr:DnaJ domain-containing protein [Kofleriaceae bacterium]